MADQNPMTKFMWQKLILLLLVGACIMIFAQWMKPKLEDVNVYVVRHAEKVTGPDAGNDPPLSEAGQKRAQVLAANLDRKGIDHIHSTDTVRTRNTAKPLADELGLTIEIYDPNDLQGLATSIKTMPGGHLIVGHSNTVPQTIEALGGDGGSPINEAGEYDRLYSVEIDKDGDTTSRMGHYGQRYDPNDAKTEVKD